MTLVLDNPENQNKNNVVMATLGFLCFSSPSKYFCRNNIMSMPEVPEVFTISWAKQSFLKQFKVQTTYLNRVGDPMRHNIFAYDETCMEFVKMFIELRHQFKKQKMMLKMDGPLGGSSKKHNSLVQAFLYYKYIMRGDMNEDFMADAEQLFQNLEAVNDD
eukprot:m51a1_g14803 hypothetical protein (160) ;mRNA; r:559494-562313